MKKHTVRWAVKEAKKVEARFKEDAELAELKVIEEQILRSGFEETLWKKLSKGAAMKKLGEAMSQVIWDNLHRPSLVEAVRTKLPGVHFKAQIHDSTILEVDYNELETRTIAAAMKVPVEFISMDMEAKLPDDLSEKLGLKEPHGSKKESDPGPPPVQGGSSHRAQGERIGVVEALEEER